MRTQLDIAGVGTIPTFGDESNIVAAAVESNSFAVAVTASEYLDGRALRELSWELDGLNIDMFVAPGVIDVAGPRLQMRPIAGMSLIHVEKPTYHGAKQFEKRLFDVMFSSLVLICGLPILVLIALAIKLTSPGPVFYRQERIGADGRPFRMIKFRTMVDGADKMLGGLVALNDSPGGVLFKMHSDPRVTPVGRILRKYSLDELPQFINVLKRDMSVVGRGRRWLAKSRPTTIAPGADSWSVPASRVCGRSAAAPTSTGKTPSDSISSTSKTGP